MPFLAIKMSFYFNSATSFYSFFLLHLLTFFWLHFYQVNHVTLSTMTTNTPLTRNFQNLGRNHGNYLQTKVKTSIEADVLAKDSATAESIDDKNGSSSFPVSTSFHIIYCDKITQKQLSKETRNFTWKPN